MKKNNVIRNLCIVAGCGLIVGALTLLVVSVASRSMYRSRCEEYASAIQNALPPVNNAVAEPGRINTMPVLPVDGVDFSALLEFPAFDTALPVCNDWGSPEKFPCRFAGNVYESTLVIGVEEHLLTFTKELYVGDLVTLTDMTGNRFSYRIENIEIADNARRETLQSTDSALTIFIKKENSSDYTILRLENAS